MIPAQFQYKDLINFTVIGFATLLLVGLLLFDFVSPIQINNIIVFLKNDLPTIGGIIIIATIFVVSFIIGTFTGRSGSYIKAAAYRQPLSAQPLNFFDGVNKVVIPAFLRKFFFFKRYDNISILILAGKFETPYTEILYRAIKKVWGIDILKILPEHQTSTSKKGTDLTGEQSQKLTEIFELCLSNVESAPSTMATIDIDRHFVLMHFHAKICFLMLLAFFLSFFECAVSFFHYLNPYSNILKSNSNQPFYIWLILCLYFYFASMHGAFRCLRNTNHWTRLIYYHFINNNNTKG